MHGATHHICSGMIAERVRCELNKWLIVAVAAAAAAAATAATVVVDVDCANGSSKCAHDERRSRKDEGDGSEVITELQHEQEVGKRRPGECVCMADVVGDVTVERLYRQGGGGGGGGGVGGTVVTWLYKLYYLL